MRILIPVLEDKGNDSEVSLHFGHAPYFAVFDSDKKELKIIKNNIDHSNPALTPVDQLMVHKLDLIYVSDIGQRAINLFKEKGIELKTGEFKTVKEVIENIDNLENLTQGCGH